MTSIRKRNDRPGYWIVDLRDIGGGQRTVKGLAAAKAAIAKAGEKGRAFKRANFQDVAQEYFDDAEARFADGEIGYGYLVNLRTYHNQLISTLALRGDIRDLTPGFIRRKVIPTLRHGRSGKTLANIVNVLSLIFDFAVDEDLIAENPMPKKKSRRGENKQKANLVEKIQPEIIHAIIENAPDRYRLPIMCAVGTGLRAGEQRALRWANVNLEVGQIKVVEAIKRAPTASGFEVGDTKTFAGERIVPIGGKLLAALKEWKLAQPTAQRGLDLVFPSATGEVADGGNWRKRGLYVACDAAKVERIRWHALRHHYASKLLDRFGENINAVKNIMGHESIETTTKTYGHWMENETRDKITGEELARAIFD